MLLGSHTRQGAAPCLRSSSLYGLSNVTPLSLSVLLYTVSLNEVSTKSLPGLLDVVSLCHPGVAAPGTQHFGRLRQPG